MIRLGVDVAVIGGSFSGSLLAMMLHRAGRTVVLLEKGSHPRFALGESSTPMTNFALEEVAKEYDLPWLAPLSKHGTWKATYPDLPVGLKRGFTFAWQQPHQPFTPNAEHDNELLVTASPNDAIGDTHWLRSDFDHLLIRQLSQTGIPYFDHCNLTEIEPGTPWRLRGIRDRETLEVTAEFVIDATGADGVLSRTLQIATDPTRLRTRSWSIYNHFADVDLWANVQRDQGATLVDHPFACDDAALHHVLGDGWIWVLRFDNHVTSAGVLLDPRRCASNPSLTPEQEWQQILARYPSVKRQFQHAKPLLDWRRTGVLQRRAERVVGPHWALVSSAAYTLDALFSTGNAHAMLSIQRLARILTKHWKRETFTAELNQYAAKLQREIDFLDMLVHGSYLAFDCFPLLSAWTMYYFAGAIAGEHRRRSGVPGDDEEILSSHLPEFRKGLLHSYADLRALTATSRPSDRQIQAFERQVAENIAPWNLAGLCDPHRKNLYPFG